MRVSLWVQTYPWPSMCCVFHVTWPWASLPSQAKVFCASFRIITRADWQLASWFSKRERVPFRQEASLWLSCQWNNLVHYSQTANRALACSPKSLGRRVSTHSCTCTSSSTEEASAVHVYTLFHFCWDALRGEISWLVFSPFNVALLSLGFC